MKNDDTTKLFLLASVIILVIILILRRPIPEVSAKIRHETFDEVPQTAINKSHCGVAPTLGGFSFTGKLVSQPQPFKWCIDPNSRKEFLIQDAAPNAGVYPLDDPVLIARSYALNK